MFYVLTLFNEKIFLKNEKNIKKLAKKCKCKVKKFADYNAAKEYLQSDYDKKRY